MLCHLILHNLPFLTSSLSLKIKNFNIIKKKRKKKTIARVMADCTKTSKRIAEAVEMEDASSKSLTPKRTKCTSQSLKLPSSTITTNSVVISPLKTPSSGFLSNEFSSSRCSRNVSPELLKDSSTPADLEKGETAVSTWKKKKIFRYTSCCGDSEDIFFMEAPPKTQRPNRPPRGALDADKMPSMAEIEEFFAEAEKRQREQFTERYNFDIGKEVALEGRYQWDRIKH